VTTNKKTSNQYNNHKLFIFFPLPNAGEKKDYNKGHHVIQRGPKIIKLRQQKQQAL